MTADLETRLRALPEHLDGLRAPGDLAGSVRSRHRHARRQRLIVATAAVAALAVAGGSAVAVGTLRTSSAPAAAAPSVTSSVAPSATPPPHGPTPTDPHLRHWPTRGPLAGDATERALVLSDLDAAARAPGHDRWQVPSTGAPTSVLWLGPGFPDRLGVTAGSFAVVQQYVRGTAWLRFLEKSGDHYAVVSGRGGDPIDQPFATFWIPTACQRPPAGVYCPQQYAMLLLAPPGTRTIRFTSDPRETLGTRPDPSRWRDARVLDGYGFTTLPTAQLTTRLRASIDGRSGPLGWATIGRPGPADPAGSPTPTPAIGDISGQDVSWLPIRGLPQLMDSPETYPGLDLWGRLHGLSVRPGYFSPLWGGTLADGSRAAVAQPFVQGTVQPYLVFAVNPPPTKDTKDTFLVRDLPSPVNREQHHSNTVVRQVSALLPLSDGRCELVVVGEPGTTGVRYAGSAIPVQDGVGTLVLPSCDGHDGARITVTKGGTMTYAGPIDSTKPGGGVKRG